MKKRINRNIVIVMSFLMIIFCLLAMNSRILYNSLYNNLTNQNLDSLQQAFAKVDNDYRNSFKLRSELININGVSLRALNKKMIGNFEFMKDDKGYVHMFTGNMDTTNFNKEINEVSKLLKTKGIPFVYVQAPSREIENFNEVSGDIIEDTNITMDSVIGSLKENEVDYIDIRDEFKNAKFLDSNIYFKTDIHLKTEAEFWMLQQIVRKLEDDYQLNFQEKDKVFNLENYSTVHKEFLGNLGRSGGKYFTELDDFVIYFPDFKTDFSVTNFSSGSVKRGEFWNTVMNGMQSDSYNTYWVTDFLQWPTPYYNIKNRDINGNNVLVIMDSLGLRMTSYLSLLCENVTVLDTRYFNGVNYLKRALANQDYDAVIFLQSTNLINTALYPDELQAAIEEENTPTNIESSKKYEVNIKAKNTGDVNWTEKDSIRLCIWQNGMDYGHRVRIADGVEVKPGEIYTFVLSNLEAPLSNKTYLEYQLVKEGVQYFGEKKRVDITVVE